MIRGVKPGLLACGLSLLFLFLGASGSTAQETVPEFRHETHRTVDCLACHTSPTGEDEHPQLTLTDCRSCHHGNPATTSCQQCHAPADARVINREMPRTLDITVGSLDHPRRDLPFRHAAHEEVRCQTCHTEGLALSAEDLDCSSCHDAHHRPTTRCRDCHEAPAAGAHDKQVHLGCGGSGCHEAAPANIRMVPRTRAFCLTCHDGMVYHKPGEACASCHPLPPPRPEGGN